MAHQQSFYFDMLQILVKLLLRFDGHASGHLTADKLSTKKLQSITCQVILGQKALLQLLLEKMDADYTDWPASVKKVACLKSVYISNQNLEYLP